MSWWRRLRMWYRVMRLNRTRMSMDWTVERYLYDETRDNRDRPWRFQPVPGKRQR